MQRIVKAYKGFESDFGAFLEVTGLRLVAELAAVAGFVVVMIKLANHFG